jgi:hypothetical protein
MVLKFERSENQGSEALSRFMVLKFERSENQGSEALSRFMVLILKQFIKKRKPLGLILNLKKF